MPAPIQNQQQTSTTSSNINQEIQNSPIKEFPDLVDKYKQFVQLTFEQRRDLLVKFYQKMIEKATKEEYKIKFQTTILILQSYDKNEENSNKINDLYRRILEASAKKKQKLKQEELQKLQQSQSYLQKIRQLEQQEKENPDDLLKNI